MFLSEKSYAQLDNSFFKWKHEFTAEGDLRLQIENLNYFRNVEFKSPIDEGRTMGGFQFVPELSYQISNKALVSGGLLLKRDVGGEGFHQIQPTFQLKYVDKEMAFLFGRLEGNMDHNLIEPLLDPERIISNRTENGFQLLLNKIWFDADIWLDWQKMIYTNSPFREEFDAGVSTKLKLISSDKLKWQIPLSVLAHHKGGEIDTSGQPTVSQFTFTYGSELSYLPSASKLKRIQAGLYFNNYEDISGRATSFIDGLGQYASVSFHWENFYGMINYWDAHQFQSGNGDVIFQSISRKNPSKYKLDYRKLYMFRAGYEKDLGNDLSFLFRTNLIRDVNEELWDFVAEFYFRWTPSYLIKSKV
jgi:hypothetical protein